MTKTFVFFGILLSISACKPRNDSTTTKSLVATDGEGNVEIVFQPLDLNRLVNANTHPAYHGQLAPSSNEVSPKEKTTPAPNLGSQKYVCFSSCKNQQVAFEAGQKGFVSDVDCEVTGYAEISAVINAAGRMSADAQERVLQALSHNEVLASFDDASWIEMKSGLQSIISTDNKKNAICSNYQPDGLSLTGELFLSPICFRNKTGSTVRIDADVTYKKAGYKYLEDKTAYWTYPSGRESCLNINGCADNEDGLCKIARVKYVASINGRNFQNNGAGIEFRSSRNTTDEYWIDLKSGSSGTNSGSSGNVSGSDDQCVKALKEVYGNYGSRDFQSSRTAEVKNCLGATQKTDWNNFRSHYYCQYPGQPVRQCFTYGAAALKKQGYSQSTAYKAMFQTCKTNGSFNSFSGNLLNDFEVVMTNDYKGCGESAINKYYQWLGISRPVR